MTDWGDTEGVGLGRAAGGKSTAAFRTISEVASQLDVPQHVLRFWESKFPQVRPLKRAGGRRYYRPEDVQLLERIRKLLHHDGYTIRGVQRLLKERGVRQVIDGDEPAVAAAPASPAVSLAPVPPSAPSDATISATSSPTAKTLPPETRERLSKLLRELEEIRRELSQLQG